MILPIYLYGQPVLRKQAANVEMGKDELKQLVSDMFETMYNANGVGLAGPQVGKSLRIFVIDSAPFKESYPNEEVRKLAFINPVITKRFGEEQPFTKMCIVPLPLRLPILLKIWKKRPRPFQAVWLASSSMSMIILKVKYLQTIFLLSKK